MSNGDRRTPAAVVGIGATEQGELPGESSDEIAARAARLFGYARAQLAERDWQPDNTDVVIEERLTAELRAVLGDVELQELIARGASLPDDQALAEAAQV